MDTQIQVDEIADKLRSYVAKNLLFSGDHFGYSDNASFLDEGIIDSLGIIELVTYVESHFGVSVLDHEMIPDNFDSIAQLSSYIHRKQRVP